MGEAANKPTSFDVSVSVEEQHTLFVLWSTPLKCPACKCGPIDTSDPVKFLKFGKVWNAFKLSEFEDLSRADLITKLGTNEEMVVNIETDVLRYLIETILLQSNIINVFTPAISILNKLISIAVENKIKIKDYEDDNTQEENKTLTLTKNELNIAATVLLNAQKCDHAFTLTNGSSVVHGGPIDHPKTVKEFKVFNKLVNQLKLSKVLVGKEELSTADETSFSVDTETVKYLSEIIPRRSMHLNTHPSKLLSLSNKLEELKK